MSKKDSILFVDDEIHNLQVLTATFSRKYQVYTASSGKEALDVLAQHDIHLVISDQRMPEMSGLELMQLMQEQYPQVIRVVLTAYGDTNTLLKALNQCHVYQYLFKPVDLEQLRLVVDSGLKKYWLTFENQQLIQKLEEANATLEKKVSERTMALSQRNDILLTISQEVNSKNEKIAQSLNYAKKLQDAVLQREHLLDDSFAEHFILMRPKDIVSGDFYWYKTFGDKTFFAQADCTGHGIPGAFMTILGSISLDQIVDASNFEDPASILYQVDHMMQRFLQHSDQKKHIAQEGMDIMMCCIDHKENKITYSGAKGLSYHVDSQGEVQIMKSGRYPVGFNQKIAEKTFINEYINYQKGDMLYLASDGFQDQHNQEREKFLKKNFIQLLAGMAKASANDQLLALKASHNAWKGHSSQTDDVLVIGLRL